MAFRLLESVIGRAREGEGERDGEGEREGGRDGETETETERDREGKREAWRNERKHIGALPIRVCRPLEYINISN